MSNEIDEIQFRLIVRLFIVLFIMLNRRPR